LNDHTLGFHPQTPSKTILHEPKKSLIPVEKE